MDFLETLPIIFDYKSSLPSKILEEYEKSEYDITISKIRISKKKNTDDIDSLIILNEINKKFKFKSSIISCENFWKENMMKKVEDGVFISDYLKAKIKSSLNYDLKLQWVYNNTDKDLIGYFDIFFESLSDILEFINKLDILIKISIFMYKRIRINRNLNTIKVFFFLTSLKKKINWNKKDTIGKNHVNSGLTSYKITEDVNCCLDNYIMIWRKEELLKVYIHELIHYFKIDSKVKFFIDFSDKFCISSQVDILPNEAYTDFIAIILNAIVHTEKNKEDLKNNMINDIKFSLFQTAKILYYFKFKVWTDFQNSKCNYYLKQNSNVFPYYIIKSALLFNFDNTLKLLKEITFDNTFNLNFNSNKENINKLEDHIFLSLSNDKFINEINQLISLFYKIDVNKNKLIINTLKMTILE